jgi:alpha-L-fucosidase
MPTYKPHIDSLRQHTTPEWYKDAKIGIYTHWGPYSVPAYDNEWYASKMYDPETPHIYNHHRATWQNMGYKDFIPMFRGENWDPEQWADLFKRAGAKFAGPVVEHHDGFAMYACSHNRWNCVEMGPKRDVTAEQKKAFEAVGMKFIATSHRAQNARYYYTNLAGSDRNDPQYYDLYAKPLADWHDHADEDFLKDWLKRTIEVIDKYEPDVLWFDGGWHHPEFLPYRFDLVSYYYNKAAEWGKEVVLNCKDHVFDGAAVYNIERGQTAGIKEEYWQTDTSVSVNSWGFRENERYKSVIQVIHTMIDIVSKNGNMLLNVGPRADGTIPLEAEGVLLAMGEWLQVNGEAIYGSRHWERFGEGPTPTLGQWNEGKWEAYTHRDFRFTQKPGVLYAIEMGWPGRETLISSLATGSGIDAANIASVTMLGIDRPLEWKQDYRGLHVTMPDHRPCDHAYTIKEAMKR